ncbi:MAG: hypothetical protein KC550_00840, partial [Nanoarchaeota archaeon]|nr:hypothetical protein [Nanoarchaeota archaeon]
IDVNPYLEISDISVDINLRNKKISKKLYNFILDYMQTNDASRVSRNILIGGVGLLGNKYDHTYSQLGIDKYIPIISRSIFSDEEWNNLENVRLETIGTKIYAERLGLKCIGSSKTHGGPIYLSENINEVLKKRV